ncbi:MAG TPA: hypothetical protein VIW67_01750 [Terriglobales bacterium]
MKLISISLFLCVAVSLFAQAPPEVKLTVESVAPRAVEPRTEQSLIRDYTAAWKTLADASESKSPTLLDAYFIGAARTNFGREVTDQQKIGTHIRYLNQVHNLKAVFYAPEGDVMQLQDSAEYQMQIVSGDKVIQDEHVVVQYVVLMTPGADRWMVRQIQAVPAQ